MEESLETENRPAVARGYGEGHGERLLTGVGLLTRVKGAFWNLVMLMTAPQFMKLNCKMVYSVIPELKTVIFKMSKE